VRDPAVFLLDEPLSNLDAKLRVQTRAEITKLHERLGTTFVYVTHDQIEAMTMADRIVVMHDGGVEQIGAPLDLYDRPINRFVAGFIGSPAMNFIEGIITTDGSSVETPQGDRFAIEAGPHQVAGRAVVYGIRPEHLELAGDGIPADVAVIEPTGSETQIVARHSCGEIVAAFRERHQIRPGERIHLRPRAQAAHLFDAQTGTRL